MYINVDKRSITEFLNYYAYVLIKWYMKDHSNSFVLFYEFEFFLIKNTR